MSTTINGTTGVSQVQDSIVTDSKLLLTANSAPIKTALNASGSAPIYACRAWVNFNGTNTVAIRASGNVSSITDDGVGLYTVNLTTPMPDAGYCVATGNTHLNSQTTAGANDGIVGTSGFTTSLFKLRCSRPGDRSDPEALDDQFIVSCSIFR